jgi:hypothetical protein
MITEKIKEFNKNPSYELFENLVSELYPNRHKCRECGKEIYYRNSKFRIKKSGIIEIYFQSFQTTKKYGEKLEVCESCIGGKYPYYNTLNKSRVFNTCNEITVWAFNIKDNLEKYKTGPTFFKLIKKYGEKEGQIRWDSYREKQAKSNLFEYKKEKHGWSEDEFDKFNKSRGITLENLIKKHGKKAGGLRWQKYLEKQKITKSFSYMVSKYGLEKAKKINNSKARTLENYIKQYGEEKGLKKYEDYINASLVSYSNVSQRLFEKIDSFLNEKYTTYYATKNTEFGVHTSDGYKKMDYYIKELKICIEFNGDIFHGNPLYFEKTDCPNFHLPELNCEQIWKKDKLRYETLLKEHDIRTVVIWESQYRNKDFNIFNFLKRNGILL